MHNKCTSVFLCLHHPECLWVGDVPKRRWFWQTDGLSQWEFWAGGFADTYTPSCGQTTLVSAGERAFQPTVSDNTCCRHRYTIPGMQCCSSAPSCTGSILTRTRAWKKKRHNKCWILPWLSNDDWQRKHPLNLSKAKPIKKLPWPKYNRLHPRFIVERLGFHLNDRHRNARQQSGRPVSKQFPFHDCIVQNKDGKKGALTKSLLCTAAWLTTGCRQLSSY